MPSRRISGLTTCGLSMLIGAELVRTGCHPIGDGPRTDGGRYCRTRGLRPFQEMESSSCLGRPCRGCRAIVKMLPHLGLATSILRGCASGSGRPRTRRSWPARRHEQQTAASVIARLARHLDHLLQDPCIVRHDAIPCALAYLLVSRHATLSTTTSHAARQSPIRAHSYVRHQGVSRAVFVSLVAHCMRLIHDVSLCVIHRVSHRNERSPSGETLRRPRENR